MLSKMASNNSGGGGGSGGTSSGRRLPLSLSGGTSVSRLQQSSGNNGRSNSPQNGNKKITESFAPIKKTMQPRTTSSSSSSSSGSSQNGVSKSTNGKEKSQNGNSTGKDQKEHKSKDKLPEKKEKDVDADGKDNEVVSEKKDKEVVVEKKDKNVVSEKEDKELSFDKKKAQEETKKEASVENSTSASQPAADVVVHDDVVEVIPDLSTPTKDRRSSRKAGSQQKSPITKPSPSSPAQTKQTEEVPSSSVGSLTPPEDVDMEPLQVDASPVRSVHGNLNAEPAATSTPGRSLFSFRGSSKQITEVELAAQPSSSPAITPARSFAQISGRRSIRPIDSLTPSKIGTYRCGNSDLDTSNCTNASMNATVGSEIPNSSSFSFSFFGRGRKRERTPPPLSATQSASDLNQDVEMSPPKRARFDLFSLNLASPFSMLRSRFSKATISSPARVLELNGSGVEEQVPISSINVPDEIDVEEEQATENVTVGQEAGLETPKKSGSPLKENPAEKDVENKNDDGQEVDERSSDGENLPPVVEEAVVAEAENRSRCSVM